MSRPAVITQSLIWPFRRSQTAVLDWSQITMRNTSHTACAWLVPARVCVLRLEDGSVVRRAPCLLRNMPQSVALPKAESHCQPCGGQSCTLESFLK